MTRELAVAIDIGGTSLKGALVDARQTVLSRRAMPTPASAGGRAVLGAVVSLVSELVGLAAEAKVVSIGLVTPGRVDAASGVVEYAANLGWRDMPLAAAVTGRCGLPVVVDHDVRAAARAEAAAAGLRDGLFVALGTGIGAAMIFEGVTRAGATGQAGELGHTVALPGGDPCACGQRGCLEVYASAAAVSKRYAAASGPGVPAATAEQIVGLLGRDPVADRVWAEAISALATALATTTLLCDPEVIVLGGGLAGAGAALLEPLKAGMAARLRWRRPPPLRLASLGADAGVLGASRLAWDSRGATG
ncbi:MAG: ROK family protein [Micromonosporaceae bacterium]|nr:ROK family protein [Micromonosporaceae bacterium]